MHEQLSGINELLYTVDSGIEYGVFDLHYVNQLAEFADWLSEQPEVIRVSSVARSPVLRDARQNNRLSERLEFYRNRATSGAAPSELAAREVSRDFQATITSVYVESLDAHELIALDTRIKSWINERNNGLFRQQRWTGAHVRNAGPAECAQHARRTDRRASACLDHTGYCHAFYARRTGCIDLQPPPGSPYLCTLGALLMVN